MTTSASVAQVRSGLPRRAERALREAFGGRLQFGTAGLRGAIGPGPNQMNRALVRRVATGLCAYLLEVVPDRQTEAPDAPRAIEAHA